MNKFIKFMTFAMIASFSLAVVSCSDDNDEPGENFSEYVGTWSVQDVLGWSETETDFEYLQLKSDGTYIDVQEDELVDEGYTIEYGKWSADDKKLILTGTSGDLNGMTFTYDIIKKENNRLTVSMMGFTIYLIKVDDSVIQKYLK